MAIDLAINVGIFVLGFLIGYVISAYFGEIHTAAQSSSENNWAKTFRPIRPIDSIDKSESISHGPTEEAILKNERIFADYVKGLR